MIGSSGDSRESRCFHLYHSNASDKAVIYASALESLWSSVPTSMLVVPSGGSLSSDLERREKSRNYTGHHSWTSWCSASFVTAHHYQHLYLVTARHRLTAECCTLPSYLPSSVSCILVMVHIHVIAQPGDSAFCFLHNFVHDILGGAVALNMT